MNLALLIHFILDWTDDFPYMAPYPGADSERCSLAASLPRISGNRTSGRLRLLGPVRRPRPGLSSRTSLPRTRTSHERRSWISFSIRRSAMLTQPQRTYCGAEPPCSLSLATNIKCAPVWQAASSAVPSRIPRTVTWPDRSWSRIRMRITRTKPSVCVWTWNISLVARGELKDGCLISARCCSTNDGKAGFLIPAVGSVIWKTHMSKSGDNGWMAKKVIYGYDMRALEYTPWSTWLFFSLLFFLCLVWCDDILILVFFLFLVGSLAM